MISFFQFLFGITGLASLVSLVPRTVILGFVDGLAIILAMGQIGQFQDPETEEWLDGSTVVNMWILIAVTIIVALGLPKLHKAFPPAMSGLLVATFVEWVILRNIGASTPTIGEVSDVQGGFPIFFWLDEQYEGEIPSFSWATFKVRTHK